MLTLLISILISFFLFYSFGILFSKILKTGEDLVNTFFSGLIFLNSLLAFTSLFFAINYKVLTVFILLGLTTLFFQKQRWSALLNSKKYKINILLYLLGFLIISFTAATLPYQVYDTGLYYLQNIQWINKYPIIPGLANLHGRFGFNPSSFLINGLTSLSVFSGKAFFSLNFVILSVLIFHYVRKVKSLYQISGFSNSLLFQLILFCCILGMSDLISSPTPDFIATALLFYVFSSYTDLRQMRIQTIKSYIPLLLIGFYLVTIKLSTVPILILLIYTFFKQDFKINTLKIIGLSGVLIISPWLIRNAILTGWLIYPFPHLDLFNFDWKVPRELVILEKKAITGWARVPGERFLWAAQTGIQQWLPIWWNELKGFEKILIPGSFLIPIIGLSYKFWKTKNILNSPPVVVTALIGVIFWFLLAPDYRFGKAFIIVAFISPLLIVDFSLKMRPWKNLPVHFIFIAILSWYGLTFFIENKKNMKNLGWFSIQESRKPENLKFKAISLENKLIYVPETGDQCFDQKFPCTTPGINLDKIEMRNSGLINGFKTK